MHREVFYSAQGDKMSRLKEVDDEWILRRLERWGRRDNMPFLGPEKAEIVKGIVHERRPRVAVEVGGMCGYSALRMAQALPPGARLALRAAPPVLAERLLSGRASSAAMA